MLLNKQNLSEDEYKCKLAEFRKEMAALSENMEKEKDRQRRVIKDRVTFWRSNLPFIICSQYFMIMLNKIFENILVKGEKAANRHSVFQTQIPSFNPLPHNTAF